MPQLTRGTAFEVVDSGYFFAGLYCAMRVTLWLQPKRPLAFSSPRFDPLQKLIGGYLSLEQRVLPKTTWGSSLYALMRKSKP